MRKFRINIYFLFMKTILSIFIILFIAISETQAINIPDITSLPSHPRILMFDNDIPIIRNKVDSSELGKIHNVIIMESNKLLNTPVLKRIKEGRRLLSISREALRRIFYLSYSYRITGKESYKLRAEKEMLALSSFEDWNPSHFLDVAEMTMAVAIGYDWLYNSLKKSSKEKIRKAIISKGIEPSFDDQYNDWLNSNHNWNQVCNTGITYGALAVFESIPNKATEIIKRSINSIKRPMKQYAPDGAYPEGFTYWSYGTSFNVMFLSAIEKIYNTDFGLSNAQGFLNSAYYIENMIAPSKKPFNYGDSELGSSLNSTMFWIANKLKTTAPLWSQCYYLKNNNYKSFSGNRILPTAIIWGINVNFKNIKEPSNLIWYGKGVTPVASMRTSWTDPNAIFVGIKAGRAGSNHSHMDIGSFIMESQGVRWAIDLGPQDYNSLESAGIDLWNRKQNSQRWDVYRYNNLAHNTLSFDYKKQMVDGYASIDSVTNSDSLKSIYIDLSEIYKDQVKDVSRTVKIINNKKVMIEDNIEALGTNTKFIWSMLTKAKVEKINDKNLLLTLNDKHLYFNVETDSTIKIYITPAVSTNNYDEKNDDVNLIRIEANIPANTKSKNIVCLYNK